MRHRIHSASEDLNLSPDGQTLDAIALASGESDSEELRISGAVPELPKSSFLFEPLKTQENPALRQDAALSRIVLLERLARNAEAEGDVEAIRRARIMAQLDHPAIVPVYSVCRDSENCICIAEKNIVGRTLREYLLKLVSILGLFSRRHLRERGPKHLLKRLNIFLRICDAVEFAHNKNIVHGTLSASGILLGEHGEVYVRGWENAIISGPRSTGKQSDLRALGRILAELVYLKLPETNGGMFDVPSSHRDFLGLPVSPELRAVIAKAMSPGGKGYRSCRELIDDVQCFLNNEETSAKPDSFPEHCMRSLARQRKTLLISALLLSILALTVFSVFLVRSLSIKQEEQRRDSALLAVHARGFAAGVEFDRRIRSFSELAYGLQKQAEALLEPPWQEPPEKCRFYSDSDGRKKETAPPGYRYSAAYRIPVDFKCFVYKTSPGSPVSSLDLLLKQLVPLVPAFRQIVLSDMGDGHFETLPLQEQLDFIRNKTKPSAGFVYLSLENGLHVCYPYHADYSADYDPRRRPWYLETKAAPDSRAHWTAPYIDNGEIGELVITCSKKLFTSHGRFIGCLGIDITLNRMIELLMRSGNNGSFVTAKYLIDRNNRVLADTSETYPFRKEGKEIRFRTFSEPELLKKMWGRHQGQFFLEKPDGKIVLYFFMKIDVLDWLYVEMIDYADLMTHFESNGPQGGTE